jgi:phytoene/squalene synthetase
VRALLEFECGRAHDYYRRANQTLPAGDRRRLVAAEIMGGIYYGILTRIERSAMMSSPAAFAFRARSAHCIALRIWITGRRV